MEEEVKVTETEEKESWLTPRKKFWARLSAWIVFALIVPVLFILFRFDIFHKETHIAIGFWGLVVLLIIFSFVVSMLRYVVKAMPYSMIAQCISGFAKIILPLGIIWLIAFYIRNNLDVFLQALGVIIFSEAVAIPINPMPKWIHDNLTEEQQKKISNISDLVLDKYFTRKKKEGE